MLTGTNSWAVALSRGILAAALSGGIAFLLIGASADEPELAIRVCRRCDQIGALERTAP